MPRESDEEEETEEEDEVEPQGPQLIRSVSGTRLVFFTSHHNFYPRHSRYGQCSF